MVNLLRPAVVNLHRPALVRLNRRRVVNFTGACTLLHNKDHELYSVFSFHINRLERINEVSNTYKHSFITSEAHSLIGKDEPVVNCLDLHRNNTAKEPKWHSYYLREIVQDYVAFFNASRDKLKEFKLPGR